MPSRVELRVSRARGVDLQNKLAAYLVANGWPSAQSVGSGRNGADILGTPGLAWENKTSDEFRILEFVRQSRRQADALDVPIVAYWPRGSGAMSVADIPTIIPLRWTVRLLRGAGYGDPLPLELTVTDGPGTAESITAQARAILHGPEVNG